MNIPEYIQAFFPTPYLVFGVKLKPFTLGHYIILRSVDSPFLSEGKERIVEINDLLFAFAVCTKTHDEAYEFVNDLDACMEFTQEMEEDLTKQADKLDFKAAISTMFEYVGDNFKVPLYIIESEGEGKESGTHWVQSLLLTLMSEVGYTRSEALNLPMSLAMADYLWHLEKNGSVRLMTDDQVKQIREAEKK